MTTIQASVRDRIKELRRVRASELLPSPKNWRRHPKAQSDALLGMLSEIGFADALLARETPQGLQLIDGHLRAALMGDTEVPVLVLDVTAEEADKLLLTLDPLAGMANQDSDALQALLRETSFESEAVNAMLEALVNGEPQPLLPLPESAPDPGPQLDKAAELAAKWGTALGQLWELPSLATPGKAHRLLCGDSAKGEDVARLMQGERAQAVITDPPYGKSVVENSGVLRGQGSSRQLAKSHAYEPIYADNSAFDPSPLLALAPNQIIFGANYFSSQLPERSCWLVWDKKGDAQSNDFADCELAWTSFDSPARIYSVLWRGMIKEGESGSRYHPTQKPVKLFALILADYTRSGDVFIDPFLGSGTTMVAAEQTGRLCYGCEIEPRYVAVALERLAGMGLAPQLSGV